MQGLDGDFNRFHIEQMSIEKLENLICDDFDHPGKYTFELVNYALDILLQQIKEKILSY